MKKTLLLSALFIALISLFKTQKAEAQITGVSISYAVDSLTSMCSLPSTDGLILNVNLTGTVPAVDSVTFYVNWDDGSDTTFKMADHTYGGSTGGYCFTNVNHVYTIPGTYTTYVLATSSSATTGSETGAPFTLTTACATISGILYVDNNSNCVRDAGELGIAWIPVWKVNTSTSDTSWAGWTNDSGMYSFSVYAGTYTIIADPNAYSWWYWWGADSNIHPTCPTSGCVTLTVAGGSTYTEDFAFACTPAVALDVMAEGWNWCFVPGDSTYVEIWAGDWWWYWDYTCSPLSSTITLTLDSRLTYGSTPSWATPPSSVSGSVLTWNYTSSYLFGFWTLIRVATSSSAVLGDTICNTVNATATSISDPDLTNNTNTFCGVVSSSYDPNGKAVAPQGTGTPGYINNGTQLTYNVHFQNTGTAAARNITVVDTLSPNVDPKTLHLLTSTAPCIIYTEGNLVKFKFNDINLPDMTTNPSGSIGSLVYAVLPKPGLAPYTQIKNQAAIYFDYNPAVLTNGTLNTIMGTTGVQHVTNANFKATVYPNPANELVYAITDDNTDFDINITDMLGRVVATGKSLNGKAALSTQSFVTGLYIVKLTNANGKELTTKLTVQH